MRDSLNLQADRIELVLARHRAPAAVIGGIVTARMVTFRLVLTDGTRIGQVARLAEELALGLGVPACRVARESGALMVQVPRADAREVELVRLMRSLRSAPPCTAVLGAGLDGAPVLLRLSGADVAHVLIAGTTGSGKTELARAVVTSLAALNRPSRVRLALIDPKVQGLAPFVSLPHLYRSMATDVDAALVLLAELAGEMEARSAGGVREPRIVLVVDELADLLMVGGREVQALLTRLTQRGRGAGIHLVACTQKPSADVVGSLLKSNFPVRLVGSVASAEDARVASGIARSGAEKLLGRGDFVLVGRGRTIRFQAARVTESEISEMFAAAGSEPTPLRSEAGLRVLRRAAVAG